MRQVAFTKTGAATVLQIRQAPLPVAASDEVVIRVAYAALNNFDIMARRSGYGVALPYTPGLEVSGWVYALGNATSGLRVGDAIAAYVGSGGYADYVVAKRPMVFKLNTSEGELDMRAGSAVPIVVPTALDMLKNVARIRPDDVILIHGAAGGVGLVAGQIAQEFGASRVIGTVGSEDKVLFAKEHGKYDEVYVRSRSAELMKMQGRIDVLLSPSGEATSDLLAPFGRVIVFGNASNKLFTPVIPAELLARNHGVAGYSITNLIKRYPEVYRQTAEKAFDLVRTNKIIITISEVYSLEDVAEAHRRLESGNSTGKLLLRVAQDSN